MRILKVIMRHNKWGMARLRLPQSQYDRVKEGDWRNIHYNYCKNI